MSRSVGALGTVLLGVLTLAVASTTWVTGVAGTTVTGDIALAVVGSTAAPGVSAAGFLLLAAAVALAIAGRVGRWLATAGVALGGVVTIASSNGVIADPGRVALAVAAERTGLSSLDGAAALTVTPYLCLGLGVVTVVWAVSVALGQRGWAASSRRHEREDIRLPDDPFGTWDALSRGDDPS